MEYNALMSQPYDLHAHSTASDGTLSPTALVARAHEKGVKVLALTDHDNTAGIEEARIEANRLGIELVAGAEISVTWGAQVVHIVALNVDIENAELQTGLNRLCDFREWRAEEIGRRLEKAGIAGAYEGARRFAKGRIVGRTHFGHFLIDAGHAKDMRQVFKRYLVRNKPGHVSGEWAAIDEAVGWIKAAGGQSVIAHPARYSMTATKLRRLFGAFKECGGDALEVVSGSHSASENIVMASHARAFDLLSSSGSDYHGPETPWTELGRLPDLPNGCEPIWADWHPAERVSNA
ncbi:PHP domain-containing protein [Solemya pervernicosa gill symbiont]